MLEIFPFNQGNKVGREGWGQQYSIKWESKTVKTLNGIRKQCSHQLYPEIEFKLKFKGLNSTEFRTLMGFYNHCKGDLLPFLYLDYGLQAQSDLTLPYDASGKRYLRIEIGDNAFPCAYAKNIKYRINGGTVRTISASQTDDNLAWIELSASSSSTVEASYDAYFKVYCKSMTFKEDSKHYYNVDVTLVTCY